MVGLRKKKLHCTISRCPSSTFSKHFEENVFVFPFIYVRKPLFQRQRKLSCCVSSNIQDDLGHVLYQSLKNKKISTSKKKIVMLRKIELYSSSITKLLIYSYISRNRNSKKKILIFQETETLKSFLYFRKCSF